MISGLLCWILVLTADLALSHPCHRPFRGIGICSRCCEAETLCYVNSTRVFFSMPASRAVASQWKQTAGKMSSKSSNVQTDFCSNCSLWGRDPTMASGESKLPQEALHQGRNTATKDDETIRCLRTVKQKRHLVCNVVYKVPPFRARAEVQDRVKALASIQQRWPGAQNRQTEGQDTGLPR